MRLHSAVLLSISSIASSFGQGRCGWIIARESDHLGPISWSLQDTNYECVAMLFTSYFVKGKHV